MKTISTGARRLSEISRLTSQVNKRLGLPYNSKALIQYDRQGSPKPWTVTVNVGIGDRPAFMNAGEAHAYLLGMSEALHRLALQVKLP